MSKSPRMTWRAILAGGLIAGSVDILAASLIGWLNPVVILQAIASGVLGPAAFREAAPSALLGLLLQWCMGILIASIFVLAASKFSTLQRRWVAAGIAYGVVIFFVMNYLVVPLSAAPFPVHHFAVRKFSENLLAMIVFGLIVSFCAHERRAHVPAVQTGDSPERTHRL